MAPNGSHIPPEQAAADTAKSAADQAANQVGDVRSRFRAVRDSEDVKKVVDEARPFLRGVAFVAALTADAPVTLAYGTYRVGRFAQKVRAERKAQSDSHSE